MGRHGMTYAEFKKIRSVLSFGPSDEASLRADNWAFVRNLVTLYNKSREEVVTPGWLITGDETMVAWRGQNGVLNIMKCPHLSWVPRKPEPLGVELKTVGDALSGIMLRIEICEGKEAMKTKKFSAEYGATTACTMRLFKPWFGTQRVVAADSWFAGVKTAWAMLDNGLHFIGDVKTNSSLFCKDALVAATAQETGAWATYSTMLTTSNGKEVPIYSVSHRRGEATHTFIASCGTTLRGSSTKAYFADDEERASGQEFELYRQAPRVLNDFTIAQPCLDRHNRYRQYILAMEKRILTNSFGMRFCTAMHGILFTDCFFAYRYFIDKEVDFKAIMGKLAMKLMHNSFLDKDESPRKSPNGGRGSLARLAVSSRRAQAHAAAPRARLRRRAAAAVHLLRQEDLLRLRLLLDEPLRPRAAVPGGDKGQEGPGQGEDRRRNRSSSTRASLAMPKIRCCAQAPKGPGRPRGRAQAPLTAPRACMSRGMRVRRVRRVRMRTGRTGKRMLWMRTTEDGMRTGWDGSLWGMSVAGLGSRPEGPRLHVSCTGPGDQGPCENLDRIESLGPENGTVSCPLLEDWSSKT